MAEELMNHGFKDIKSISIYKDDNKELIAKIFTNDKNEILEIVENNVCVYIEK
ncbi:MAG: hypothetical protein ACK5KL_02645 [Dysgonomonas sp.]